MHVRLAILWQIVVEYVRDVIHVEAAASDVGGDKRRIMTELEIFQQANAFLLIKQRRDAGRGDSLSLQNPNDMLHPMFIVAEDNRLDARFGQELVYQIRILLVATQVQQALVDLINGDRFRLDAGSFM